MKFSINIIEQLEKDIKKLQLEKELAKSGFSQSLHRTQSKAKKFVLKKASLPSAAVGFGILAVKMISDSKLTGKNKNTVHQKNKPALLSLIPVLIPVLRTFLLKRNIDLNSILDGLTSSEKDNQMNDLTNP